MKPSARSLITPIVAIALIAGCQRQAEPAPTPAPVVAPTETSPTPTATADNAAAYEPFVPSGPALDQRAFAGRFTGTLPCAVCAGVDTVITVKDDYTFEMSEIPRGEKVAAPSRLMGTWTAEEDGHRIRLDPDSKSEDDRLFQVLANDEIRMLDRDGKPQPADQDYSLHRAAANN